MTAVGQEQQAVLHQHAARLVELARRRKLIEDEEATIKAKALEDMDTWGLSTWNDERVRLDVRERAGSVTADVKALQADGLLKYLRQGKPSRFVQADHV